jgi:hypothetical protein
MKRMLLSSVLAFGALVAAMPAQASIQAMWPAPPPPGPGTVPVTPGASGDQTLPPWGISVNGPGNVIFNANLYGPSGIYRLDYYGAEAAFRNQFVWNGNVIFSHPGGPNTIIEPPGSPPPTPIEGPVFVHKGNGHSLLPFAFWIDSDAGNALANGSNNPAGGLPDFAITVNPNLVNQPGISNVWHLWFDDGNPIDDDNDDLWVRVAYVPTPAAVLLFGAGLLGLGIVRRRAATQA